VEAALAGLPVIQLATPGATDIPEAREWGMSGTARSEAELREMLLEVLAREPQSVPKMDRVFANVGRAANLIAQEAIGRSGTLDVQRQPEKSQNEDHDRSPVIGAA
jgi:hypothetical protein